MISLDGDQQRSESIAAEKWALRIARFDALDAKSATGEPLGAYEVASATRARIMRVRDGGPAAVTQAPSPSLGTKKYPASRHLVGIEDEAAPWESQRRSSDGIAPGQGLAGRTRRPGE
jgi:hypothetical protein